MTLTCETPRPEFTHHVSHFVAGPTGFSPANPAFYYPQSKSGVCSKLLISEHKPVHGKPAQVSSLFAD